MLYCSDVPQFLERVSALKKGDETGKAAALRFVQGNLLRCWHLSSPRLSFLGFS